MYSDSDYGVGSQMALAEPERVDERLDRVIKLAGKEDKNSDGIQGRKIQNAEAEFMKATKPRPVIVPGDSDMVLPTKHEAPLSPGSPAPAQGLLSLPPNVLLEVASHIYPRDLIHLSHTSKPLRRRLISRKGRPIWTTALSNLVELPPCPADMCEPLYAALVFGQHCFACGADDAFSVDYALRLRLCEQCYKANVVEGTDVLQSLPKDRREIVCDVIFMLVPSANTFNFSEPSESFHRAIPLSHIMQDLYFKPELEAVLNLFWPFPTPEDMTELRPWIKERVACVAQRQAHAILLHAWDRVMCAAPDHTEELDVYSEVKAEFQDTVDIQLPESECGWADALSEFSYFAYAARFEPPSAQPKPQAQIAEELRARSQREDAARASRIRSRYAEMVELYTCIMDDHLNYGDYEHDAMPNAYDGVRLWDDLVHADDARAPIDVDNVMSESRMESVMWELRDYPQDIMRCLAAALEYSDEAQGRKKPSGGKGKGKKGKDLYEGPEDIVQRPTALFHCGECGDCPYGWPEINAHWREKHPDESVWISLGEGRKAEYKAGVWEAGVDVAGRIVEVLVEQGLGKWDRTKTRLDTLIKEGRVFCPCGDPTMATPDGGLNWAALVKHVCDHLDANARRTLVPLKTSEENVAWIDDHGLASCIKYLPAGADTSPAANRFEADPDTRRRINELLSQCPEKSRPVCCLCSALTPDDRKDSTLFLPEGADAMLYHMQTKHVKSLWEQDIAFLEESVLKKA